MKNTEPVVLGGLLIGLVQALLAVLVGFEVVHWTTEQIGLVMALVLAIIALVTFWQRSRVTPVNPLTIPSP